MGEAKKYILHLFKLFQFNLPGCCNKNNVCLARCWCYICSLFQHRRLGLEEVRCCGKARVCHEECRKDVPDYPVERWSTFKINHSYHQMARWTTVDKVDGSHAAPVQHEKIR